jgi:hypothetical protein
MQAARYKAALVSWTVSGMAQGGLMRNPTGCTLTMTLISRTILTSTPFLANFRCTPTHACTHCTTGTSAHSWHLPLKTASWTELTMPKLGEVKKKKGGGGGGG